MTDITPKTRLDGKRGHVIRTRPWADIAERYRSVASFAPMLRLIEAIAASAAHEELFGATSMFDLLLSDCEDFRRGDSTLCIRYNPSERQFVFCHRSFSSRDDEKICAEAEALQTLRLFLRLKFGVLFEIPSA